MSLGKILLFLPVQHSLSPHSPVKEQADDGGQKRPRRRSQSHGKKGRGKEFRGQISTRDTHQRNGQDVVKKGVKGFAVRAEISAETELDPGGHAVDRIIAQILSPETDHLRFPGDEQSHDPLSSDLAERKGDQPDADTDAHAVLKRLLSSPVESRARVLGSHC